MGRAGKERASRLRPPHPCTCLPPGVAWAGRGAGAVPQARPAWAPRQEEGRPRCATQNFPGLRPTGSVSGNSGGRVEREALGEPQLSRAWRRRFLSPRKSNVQKPGCRTLSAARLPSSSLLPEASSGPGRLRARKARGRGPWAGALGPSELRLRNTHLVGAELRVLPTERPRAEAGIRGTQREVRLRLASGEQLSQDSRPLPITAAWP